VKIDVVIQLNLIIVFVQGLKVRDTI
jgi:hypothetical protein